MEVGLCFVSLCVCVSVYNDLHIPKEHGFRSELADTTNCLLKHGFDEHAELC